MIRTVTLEQAMQYCGFSGAATTSYEKVKFFFHCVRQISPEFEEFGHYPMDDDTPASADAWEEIRDDVKERVRVYRRGGVHQSSDNVVVVETDEEFAYNKKVKKQLEEDEEAGLYVGATKTAVDRDYNQARRAVREAQSTWEDKLDLNAAILHLAVVYLRYRGTPGWHTRVAVVGDSADLAPIT